MNLLQNLNANYIFNNLGILKNNLFSNLDIFSSAAMTLPMIYYIKRLIFNRNKKWTLINLILHLVITNALLSVLTPLTGDNKILLTKLIYMGTAFALFIFRKTTRVIRTLWKFLPLIILLLVIFNYKYYQNINLESIRLDQFDLSKFNINNIINYIKR